MSIIKLLETESIDRTKDVCQRVFEGFGDGDSSEVDAAIFRAAADWAEQHGNQICIARADYIADIVHREDENDIYAHGKLTISFEEV